jgi:hypothetical protein
MTYEEGLIGVSDIKGVGLIGVCHIEKEGLIGMTYVSIDREA